MTILFGLPEKQMALLMFALPQPYCFNFIEASFSGSLFHHFPQPCRFVPQKNR
ncbi:hypothetical protein [Eikenella corrodens]|uniref:hypothetical protein n=1 Tax=Eikenella corrodens TaxID=539 RepID=UPI0013E0B815|nr:hypothetical protein [Eikenella corrodens]